MYRNFIHYYYIIVRAGEVPKRLKGAVSKTARRCKSCKGSNPFFSAKKSNKSL